MERILQQKFSAILEAISLLKALPLTYEYAQEKDGSFSGHVFELNVIENAQSLDALISALIAGMREWAEIYSEKLDFWIPGRPQEFPYVLKVLCSTDGELKTCLHGKN